MTATPTRLAQQLADAAAADFRALQQHRPAIDAQLGKLTESERATFESELKRLMKRDEITRSKPNFRRQWSAAKG